MTPFLFQPSFAKDHRPNAEPFGLSRCLGNIGRRFIDAHGVVIPKIRVRTHKVEPDGLQLAAGFRDPRQLGQDESDLVSRP
jgi:hypothetical protein